ncbi:Zinc finger protein [Neolecta irregularis DAH-3]|uniref:Zinc finger protein n=1 Tax=Neolecta irregularis (strain DAH-3) TaxID=1198029 RepID=A0A1U7LS79_NEOID|nr:Zinc finger protein [Neolecta irregularis DAH-3]|eukprot:OLL25530.1 Zinc finger protein [Neolecta irregularis DAH-3]
MSVDQSYPHEQTYVEEMAPPSYMVSVDDGRKRRMSESSRDQFDYDGSKRRRSRSPNGIDRYIPGGGLVRGRGHHGDYYTPRYDRRGAEGLMPNFPYSQRTQRDPYELESLVSFAYYCDWYRIANSAKQESVDDLSVKYEKYRQDLICRLSKRFSEERSKDEWFRERYLPELYEKCEAITLQYQKILFEKFKLKLEQGMFDELKFEIQENSDDANGQNEQNGDIAKQHEPVKMNETEMSTTNARCSSILLIEEIPLNVSRSTIYDQVKGLPNFLYLSLSQPSSSNNFYRTGYIIFSAAVDVEKILATISEQPSKDSFRIVAKAFVLPKKEERISLPVVFSTRERVEADEQQARTLVDSFESQLGEEFRMLPFIESRVSYLSSQTEEDNNEADRNLEKAKTSLDLIVEYLRCVHFFCLYCVHQSDSLISLQQICPSGHARLPLADIDAKLDRKMANWLNTWTHKISLIIDPESASVRKLGGIPIEDHVNDAVRKVFQQEDEGKFRCRIGECAKLFKGEEFVRKHIEKRHKEYVDKAFEEGVMLNNYVRDPSKLIPPAAETPLSIDQIPHEVPTSTIFPGYFPGMYFPVAFIPMVPQPPSRKLKSPLPRQRGRGYGDDPRRERGLRSYQDLDAPKDEVVELDY